MQDTSGLDSQPSCIGQNSTQILDWVRRLLKLSQYITHLTDRQPGTLQYATSVWNATMVKDDQCPQHCFHAPGGFACDGGRCRGGSRLSDIRSRRRLGSCALTGVRRQHRAVSDIRAQHCLASCTLTSVRRQHRSLSVSGGS